jgi:broad specificity phosphatase PhoE
MSKEQNMKSKKLIFMRHGALGNRNAYDKMKFDAFMERLQGKNDPPLIAKDSIVEHFKDWTYKYNPRRIFGFGKIDHTDGNLRKYNIKTLPKQVDVIYCSPSKRARQTAKLIQKNLPNKPKIEYSLQKYLAEVKFSEEILSKEEFNSRGGLKGCRSLIIERWLKGNNKESIQHSLIRLKKLIQHLEDSPYENILLITHSWYLRLVNIFFEGEHPDLRNMISVEIPDYGQMFEYNLKINGKSTVTRLLPKSNKNILLDLALQNK